MKNLSHKFGGLVLDPLATVPYYSNAEFSSHDVLEFLLSVTGPASVRISSFSLSEISLRSFVRLLDGGLIMDLRCLLDLSVKRHRLGLLFFAANIQSNVALAKNHAKIILVENERYAWVVVGSANLNQNDKIEAGVASGSPEIYSYFSDAFNQSYEQGLKVTADEFNR